MQLKEMKESEVRKSGNTYSMLFHACELNNKMEVGLEMLKEMRVSSRAAMLSTS